MRSERRPRSPVSSPARPSRTAAAIPLVGGSQKLHKILAQAGLGSRRLMEEWIRGGRVTVNGAVATIGDRVSEADVIQVDGRTLRLTSAATVEARVLLYHKPEGEIVTRDDPQGRDTVFERLPAVRGGKWLAIGRLDYNTSGLLIFTTSGDLANRLTHPRFAVEREYAVRILGTVTEDMLERLRKGIALPDGVARCERIESEGGEGANRWYRLVVNEGRNRVVRRMFEALGLTVSRLMRVRFGAVVLPPSLRRGQTVEFTPEEVARLRAWLDGEAPEPAGKAPSPNRPDSAGRRSRPRRSSRST